MKYTEHKLTDAMLQRLSKVCQGRRTGGISMRALEARELIEYTGRGNGWEPTEAGTAALARARAEGW